MSIQGQLADATVAVIVAQKAKIVAFLGTEEANADTAVKNTIKNLPKAGGVLGYVLPIVETELNAEVDALANKFGPEDIYNLALAEAQLLAKDLGG